MLELVAAMTIALIVAGLATPGIMQMVHSSRLRGVASDFTGLIQQDRIRSVQDDRSYSVDVNAAAGATPATGYIDLKQNSTMAVGDPEMLLPTEVTMEAAASAPNTANLKTQLLPALSPVVPQDAAPASGTPITFSPRGLPCTPVAYACSGAGLAPAAYWACLFRGHANHQLGGGNCKPCGPDSEVDLRPWRLEQDVLEDVMKRDLPYKMPVSRNPQLGMTLVELMIAMLVLAVGLGGMSYVDCSVAGGTRTTYDVRWNVMTISANNSRLITASARQLSSTSLGGLRFALPVNLRGIGGHAE